MKSSIAAAAKPSTTAASKTVFQRQLTLRRITMNASGARMKKIIAASHCTKTTTGVTRHPGSDGHEPELPNPSRPSIGPESAAVSLHRPARHGRPIILGASAGRMLTRSRLHRRAALSENSVLVCEW
jgi:hypothetical protein